MGTRPKQTLISSNKTSRWLINTSKKAQHCSLLEICKSNYSEVTIHPSEWSSSENLLTVNAGENVEKRETLYAGGNVN